MAFRDLGKKFGFKKRDRSDNSAAIEKPEQAKKPAEAKRPQGDSVVPDAKDPFKDSDITVVKELGRGGFAVVYEAHVKGRGEPVAMRIVELKHILTGPSVWTKDDLRKRTKWALKMMETCDCPYIVRFVDCRITKDHMVGFMSLAKGGDLFDRVINSGPDGHFSEPDARLATLHLCEALNWVHLKTGIIHRDIKPENILYRSQDSDAGDLLLADFGCCLATPPNPIMYDDEYEGIAGSAGYLAPEMLVGKYNMKVDNWSLGITIYEILTGRSPLVSQTPEELAEETLSRAIPYPARYWSKHSKQARSFVMALLEKDPKRRLRIDEALKHPWLTGEAVLERHDSTMSDLSMSTTDSSAPLILRKTNKTTLRMTTMSINRNVEPALGILTGGNDSGVAEYDTSAVLDGKVDSPRLAALQSIGSGSGSMSETGSPLRELSLEETQPPSS